MKAATAYECLQAANSSSNTNISAYEDDSFRIATAVVHLYGKVDLRLRYGAATSCCSFLNRNLHTLFVVPTGYLDVRLMSGQWHC
jgi:hypothetical protein